MASSQPNISSRMCRGFFLSCRDSLNRSRATHNKNCRRDLFLACFHASDPSWTPGSPGLQPGLRLGLGFQYILNVVFPASIRSTVHRRGSGVSTDISRSCCSTGAGSPYFLSRPVPSPLQIQFSHSYACVNLQTFATSRIVLHLLANPGSTLFRVRFCSLPMNNNVIKRCTIDRHTILSQVCPRDVAPTWRQRQMDKLRSCDLNILCGVGSSFGDIQGRPRRAFQLSTFHRFPTFIFRTLGAFTNPSVVMMRMLPVRAWCPRDRPTYSFGCIRRPFPHALPEKISPFVSASSPLAWQTQRHHLWRALQLGFHAKPIQCQQCRSLENYDRWLSITLRCQSAIPKSTQEGH